MPFQNGPPPLQHNPRSLKQSGELFLILPLLLSMAKPNWKRRGLKRPITEKARRLARETKDLERFLAKLPPELRDVARNNRGLLRY